MYVSIYIHPNIYFFIYICVCIYIKGCETQPGLGKLKYDVLLLSQEQVYKVYKEKKPKLFFPASGMI